MTWEVPLPHVVLYNGDKLTITFAHTGDQGEIILVGYRVEADPLRVSALLAELDQEIVEL